MKKILTIGAAAAVVMIFVSLLYTAALYFDSETQSGEKGVVVRVHPGEALYDIQAKLEKKGVLEHSTIFRWAAYLKRKEKDIKAGEYLFKRGESVRAVLSKLSRGIVEYKRIVVPEGFMVKEIASLLYSKAGIDSSAFESAVRDDLFIEKLGFEAESLEGYLFPDTYLISWPYTAREIAAQMVERFKTVYSEEITERADSLSMTMHEIVTLASIVQAEAMLKSEMPRISAVYHNRLEKGMKLEADPTVAYALGGVRRKLWYNDLKVKSPYNTYIHKGLPPGPVCSPGRAALAAAAYPAEDCGDYYFVADGKGGHIFSRTHAEHNRAKRRVKSENKKSGR
ncbi:MAG: endolytic transglycosylase MltG [Candidatus Krumholzibacteriota bacterium]|nr:endolytic transglycosylase MltG [Candidatus Krumholzibacteriota bacterium]